MKAPFYLLPLLAATVTPLQAQEAIGTRWRSPRTTETPLQAQEAADFSTAIRKFLPPAKAEVLAPAAEEPAATAETPAEAPEAAAPAAEEAPLTYTADEGPVKDTTPAAHAEEYKKFCGLLKEAAEKNLYDFCPAASVVLGATNDEFALETWMEKAAAEGIAPAMQYVADRRMSNIPADKLQSAPVKAAYAMVRKAADAGYDPAKINVYMCMGMGIGTAKDEKGADNYLMAACKSGSPIPRFKWLQMTGRLADFADKDRPEVKAEIDRRNHHVTYFLATKAPTDSEAFEWFKKAAEMGNPEAFYAISAMLSHTEPKQSFDMLSQAVKLHSSEAMCVLGNVLTEGKADVLQKTGLQHDDVAGRRLMKLAAMTGNPTACYWLGKAYSKGEFGLRKDAERAYRHFETGSVIGSPACGLSQGIMLLRGLGVKKDERKGLYYLNMSANAGNPEAVVALAYALYTGAGVPKDPAKAAEILQEAAALQYPRAYVYLAYITAKDSKEGSFEARQADKYLRKAQLDLSAEDKKKAQELYDTLQKDGWVPEP